MATSTFVCSLFLAVGLSRGPMPIPIQGPCQSRKTAENFGSGRRLGHFANQDLVGFPILLPSLSRGGGPRAKRVVEGSLGEHSPAAARRNTTGVRRSASDDRQIVRRVARQQDRRQERGSERRYPRLRGRRRRQKSTADFGRGCRRRLGLEEVARAQALAPALSGGSNAQDPGVRNEIAVLRRPILLRPGLPFVRLRPFLNRA